MPHSTAPAPSEPKTNWLRLFGVRLLQGGSLFVVIGAILFLTAGRWDWWEAWLFLGFYLAISFIGLTWMTRRDPAQAEERERFHADAKAWDKVLVPLNFVLTLALYTLIGLDAGRFGWSHMPVWLRLVGLLGFIPAFGLPLWAARVNTFLSSQVRIQAERGHQVVAAGPYRYVRHPMYAGMCWYAVCVPLLLGSFYALVVSAVMIGAFVARTALEDKTLQAELPGYADYARQVRYRWLPGVW